MHLLKLIATTPPYKTKRALIHAALPDIYPGSPNERLSDRTCTGILHLSTMWKEGLLNYHPGGTQPLYTLTKPGHARIQTYQKLIDHAATTKKPA
jgi:hypothetical protein